MSRGFKQDAAAVALWGNAYADIPKSVFAVAAWHLANAASGQADVDGAALQRFRDELDALRSHLAPGQADRALKALAKLEGGAK